MRTFRKAADKLNPNAGRCPGMICGDGMEVRKDMSRPSDGTARHWKEEAGKSLRELNVK